MYIYIHTYIYEPASLAPSRAVAPPGRHRPSRAANIYIYIYIYIQI